MRNKLKVLMPTAIVVFAAACNGSSNPAATTAGSGGSLAIPADPDAIPFDEVRAFIEFNSADEDIGFHVELDGDPWASATLYGPDGRKLFDLISDSTLNDQGLSGNFFESAEYPPDEVSREDFFARFPEGKYTLIGHSTDGEPLMSTGTFTHLIPDYPVIVSPGEDVEVTLVDDIMVAWEPVSTPAGVEIEVYQVQLFPIDPPEGDPPIELNIDLTFEVPSFVTEIRIPAELFMPGSEYEFELMAVDVSGNQTFAVGAFQTAG